MFCLSWTIFGCGTGVLLTEVEIRTFCFDCNWIFRTKIFHVDSNFVTKKFPTRGIRAVAWGSLHVKLFISSKIDPGAGGGFILPIKDLHMLAEKSFQGWTSRFWKLHFTVWKFLDNMVIISIECCLKMLFSYLLE